MKSDILRVQKKTKWQIGVNEMDRSMLKRMFIGCTIIGVGLIFLLNQMGYLHYSIGDLISTFWPVILIVIGVDGLLDQRRGSRLQYLIPAGIGVLFLARNLGFTTLSLGDLIRYAIPVAVILVGVSMIFKPRGLSKPHQEDEWSSYSNSEFDSPIPPAPPLHPDPTKPGAQVPPAESYENFRKPNGDTYAEGYNKKRNGSEGYHSKSSCKTKSGKHDRMELWDYDPNVQTRSNFIGDIHMGQDYWELKPMNISHFIGDTVLDLTKAQIPYGETKIRISAFIGDVKVFLPNDYEIGIHVVSSAFIGDSTILDRKDSGIFRNADVESVAYEDCDKKISLIVSAFIGDIRVTKVG